MTWKNSKYTITLNQLATIIAKCHGTQLTDKDGYPVVNPLDVDPAEKVELQELITCQDCKHWCRFWPETKELYGTCQVWYKQPTRYDGWCYKARKG